MVELMNQRQKEIAEMKTKAKRDKPLTPAQQKEYMRAFVKNQCTAIYTIGWTWKDVRGLTDDQLQNRSGETLESLESKKLKSSHSIEQSAALSDTTSISVGATIAAGDPISAVPSVSAASSILAETPIAAGVSTTAGFFESASVPIIDLLNSPPKATSLPLDSAIAKQAVPLRKSSRKKSMARRRTLPRPSQSESVALPFDKDDPEAEFKKYLRQVSDDDEPAEPVSLSLVSDIHTWELMHWVGRADLMVLYGMVLDKYKLERATGIGLGLWSDLQTISGRSEAEFYALPTIHVLEIEAGHIMYKFVDKKYPILPSFIESILLSFEIHNEVISCADLLKVCKALTMSARVFNCPAFKLEEIIMAMMTCLKSSGVHYQ
nr:hypothetical protein [Tanacetum cinerariifolium]